MAKNYNKLKSIDGGTSVISGGRLVPLPIPDKERKYYEVDSDNPKRPDSTRVDNLFLDDKELLEQKGNTLRVASNILHTTDLIYKLAPKIGFQKAFDIGYNVQEKIKDKYHLNDDGTKKAQGGIKTTINPLMNEDSENGRYYRQLLQYAANNPKEFWADTPEASKARLWLNNNAQDDLISQYFVDKDKIKIDSRFIPEKAREIEMSNRVTNSINNFGEKISPIVLGLSGGAAGAISTLAGEAINMGINAISKGNKNNWGDLFINARKHPIGNTIVNLTNPGYLTSSLLINGLNSNLYSITNEFRNSFKTLPTKYSNTPSFVKGFFNNESNAYKNIIYKLNNHYSTFKPDFSKIKKDANRIRYILAKETSNLPEGVKREIIESPEIQDALVSQNFAYNDNPKVQKEIASVTINNEARSLLEEIASDRRARMARSLAGKHNNINLLNNIKDPQLREIAKLSPAYTNTIIGEESLGSTPEEIVKYLLNKKYSFVRGINLKDGEKLNDAQIKDVISRIPIDKIGGRADSQIFGKIDNTIEDIGYLQNSVPSAIAYTYPESNNGTGILGFYQRDPKTFNFSGKTLVDWWKDNDFPKGIIGEAKSTTTLGSDKYYLKDYPFLEKAIRKHRIKNSFSDNADDFLFKFYDNLGNKPPYRHILIKGKSGELYPLGIRATDYIKIPKLRGDDFIKELNKIKKDFPINIPTDDITLFNRGHVNYPTQGLTFGLKNGGIMKLNNLFSRGIRIRSPYPNYIIKNAIFGKYNNHPRFYALGGEDNLTKNYNHKRYRLDLAGLKTTGGRHYNNKYIQYIYNKLGDYNYSENQKAAILANIIEESGGNPYAVDSTNKFKGLLQWEGSRYTPTEQKNIYKEIDNQLDYIYQTSNNLDDKLSWTHGGKGSGYQSLKEAHSDWSNSNDLDTIMRGYTLGYVRPTGKVESYNNRLKVAKQLIDRFNAKQEINELGYWDPEHNTMFNPDEQFKFGGKDKMINLKQIGINNGLIHNVRPKGKLPQRKLTGGDYNLIGAGISGIANTISMIPIISSYKNMKRYKDIIPQSHITFKQFNPNSEISNVDNEYSKLYRGLYNNTGSSQNLINRTRSYRNMQMADKGKILNYAENVNNEIQNNERSQNAQIDANINAEQNRTRQLNTNLDIKVGEAIGKELSTGMNAFGDIANNSIQNQFRIEDSYNSFMANALASLKVLPEEEQQKILNSINMYNPAEITLFRRRKNII